MTQDTRPAADWPLQRWLRWLEQGRRGEVLLGLERVQAVLQRLALPHRPTLTIAGTNGKGSCAHFAAQLAQALGQGCGLYTSPHLCRFNERVQIDGQMASDEALAAAFWIVEQARGEIALTYFEMATLAALVHFEHAGVGLRVLEVGLGGRLDAVNAVDADACVITSIGLDHQRELGGSLDAIAREKAGVARRGRPAILAMAAPPAALLAALAERGAEVRLLPVLTVVPTGGPPGEGGGAWQIPGVDALLPPPQLPGEAVRRNLAAAVLALQALKPAPQALAETLPQAVGRFRLAGRLQSHDGLLLDVAHNADAGREVAAVLREGAAAVPERRHWLVLGMLQDKAPADFLAAFAGLVDGVFCASLPPPRGLTASALAASLPATPTPVLATCDSVAEAVAAARRRAAPADCILVSGSFLTVAEVLCR